MKIAISTAVYYPMTNGVAVFSHNLAKGLAARGHDVLVLCPSQTGKNFTVEEDGVKGRGSCDAKGMKSAIAQAVKLAGSDLSGDLEEKLKDMPNLEAEPVHE